MPAIRLLRAQPLHWGPAILSITGAVTLLVLGLHTAQFPTFGQPWRLEVAGAAAAALVVLALGALLACTPGSKWISADAWNTAALPTAVVAAIGLTMVGLYALFPPALEYSHYRAWDYHDRRWLVLLYLLGCGLVYTPAVFRRLLGDEDARAGLLPAMPAQAIARRAALAATIGTSLAVLYVAPFLPFALERFMDPHEMVHLGGFQRIAQGATPYLDARTQYGPGYQLVTYWLMSHTGFSLYGFRLSQAWLNIAGAAILFSLWLAVFGARRGGLIIAASLALSPLLIVTWWGWGLVLRWVGPMLVGALLPPLIWTSVPDRWRNVSTAALGVTCGVLAWLAQENLTGPIIAMALVVAAAYTRGALPLRAALRLAGFFVASEIATLVLLMFVSFGPAGFGEAMSLYFHSTSLVFQGMTNTPWTESSSTWRRAYPATPFVIMLVSGIALYARPRKSAAAEREYGQLLGIAAAAVPLTMITLFRADGAHFVATSTALAPLLILTIAVVPGAFHWRMDRANIIRLALIAIALLLYFNPRGNFVTRISNPRGFTDPRLIANPRETAAGLARLAGNQPVVPANDSVLARLGFVPAADARCCYIAPWSWGEWNDTTREVHRLAAGRSVFIDVPLPLESSGIAFLADLRPSSSYVSEIMSVWTDEDVRTIAAEFRRKPPDCVLSTDPSLPLTAAALGIYREFTVTRVAGPVGLTFYCSSHSG